MSERLARRGFLGALGALAGVAATTTLSPASAAVIKAGEKYGDRLIEEAYHDGIISLETAESLVSTPLRELSELQAETVKNRIVSRESRAYFEACFELMTATHKEKMQTVCLLAVNRDYGGTKVFEGPMLHSYTEEDEPFRMDFHFEYDCDRDFTYDGIQIVTFTGKVLPEAWFPVSPVVNKGDILKIDWHLTP